MSGGAKVAGRFAFRMNASLGLEGPEALALWEHGSRAVAEEPGAVVGYFDERLQLPLAGEWQELDDVDFLDDYYRQLEPIPLGPLVIAPTHRRLELTAGQKALWLDPGMAFGTGHHETTQLALEALTRLDLSGKRVLDLGSGSGILTIAADLLGAPESLGIDVDPDTIPVAKENARLNRSRALFRQGELDAEDRADVLVANLYAELHVELAGLYREAVRPGGLLLLTGILSILCAPVEEAVREWFDELEWRERDEWRLLAARRR